MLEHFSGRAAFRRRSGRQGSPLRRNLSRLTGERRQLYDRYWQMRPPYRAISVSRCGSSSTLSCSLGSVRATMAEAGAAVMLAGMCGTPAGI